MKSNDHLHLHHTIEKRPATITLVICNEFLSGSLPIHVGAKLLVHRILRV